MSDAASNNSANIVDTGRLLVALSNLKAYNPAWAQRINNLVYNVNGNRSQYAALLPQVQSSGTNSISIYDYYIDSGFASFWPSLNTIQTIF